VVKIFQGPDEPAYLGRMRGLFDAVKSFKPKSSRSESFEMFCVGWAFGAAREIGPQE
jgi:23S rRNA (uridine2552-2'-O)-methyltransferase